MAASGGTILHEFKQEIDKVTERHEHALGYAPGMDNLEMEDWDKLNGFLKEMRKTYADLERRYAYQYGLTSNDVSEIKSECYKKVGIKKDEFLACVKEKTLNLQATKGLPLNL